MTLEERLLDWAKKGYVNEEALLFCFAGCSSWNEINAYRNKIDAIEAGFDKYLAKRKIPLTKQKKVAKALHNYLWDGEKQSRYSWLLSPVNSKPANPKKRYARNVYKLTEVIDNHIAGKEKEGNCLGMTSLYTVLALRKGLDVAVMLNHNHIFSRCKVDSFFGKRSIDIENTRKDGFRTNLRREYGRSAAMFKEHGVKGLLAAVLVSRACDKSLAGNQFAALADYFAALSLDCTVAVAYYNIGILAFEMGFDEDGQNYVENALRLNSFCAPAYVVKAQQHRKNKDYAAAIRECTNAVNADPRDYYNFYLRANAEMDAKDYWNAIKDYTAALKLMKNEDLEDEERRKAVESSRFSALQRRGQAHYCLRNLQAAVADLRSAFEQQPLNREAFRDLLFVRSKMNDVNGAISDCDFAISKHEDDADWYKVRARLKKEIGDTAGAMADYEKAEEIAISKLPEFGPEDCWPIGSNY